MNFLVIWFVLWGWGKNWKHLLRFPNLYQQIILLPKICVWRWNKDRTIFLFWIMTVVRWARTGKAHKESGWSNLFEKWFNWVLAHTHGYKMGTKHFWSHILIFIRFIFSNYHNTWAIAGYWNLDFEFWTKFLVKSMKNISTIRSRELQKFNWLCCTSILNWSE